MKISLEIPDEVWRLVEFLPENELPTILIKIIKESIESKSVVKADDATRSKNSEDIKQFIEEIRKLTTSSASPSMPLPASTTSELKSEKVVIKPNIKIISSESLAVDDEEDLDDDLLDLMG